MDKDQHHAISIVTGRQEAANPLAEYRQRKIKISQLLWEADYSIRNGQWDKAKELLFQVRRMTNEHDNNRMS